MELKPFEIVAECEMAVFPTGADIEHVSEQIEKARHSHANVVRTAVSPPAIFRDRRYVLQTRFVVWAGDGVSATRVVEDLLEDAGVPCRTVLPSGRELTESTVAPPPGPVGSVQPDEGSRKRKAKSTQPKVRVKRGRTRTTKAAARRRRRS